MSETERPKLPDLPNPERNVFLMVRFRETESNERLTEAISTTLGEYGLNLLRADMRDYQATLWENVRTCMEACDYGIAVFEVTDGEVTSPNVSLELGYMLAKERPCLLLKDERVSFMQADLAGHLCQKIDMEDVAATVPPPIRRWLRDLGIAKRLDERLVIFVSHGGTCRDPMAKAITEVLLGDHATELDIRVEARALGDPTEREASPAARRAITEMFGGDMLAAHRPAPLTHGLREEADLILVMTDEMRRTLPADKSFLLTQFFGSGGDIANPWRRGQKDDEETRARYRRCVGELRATIEPNLHRLIDFLESTPTTARR